MSDHVAIEPETAVPSLVVESGCDVRHRKNADCVARSKALRNRLDTLSSPELPAWMARAPSEPLGSIEQPRQHGDTKSADGYIACKNRPQVLPDIPPRHRGRCCGKLGVLARITGSVCRAVTPRLGRSDRSTREGCSGPAGRSQPGFFPQEVTGCLAPAMRAAVAPKPREQHSPLEAPQLLRSAVVVDLVDASEHPSLLTA